MTPLPVLLNVPARCYCKKPFYFKAFWMPALPCSFDSILSFYNQSDCKLSDPRLYLCPLWPWWSVVWHSSTAGLSRVISSRKHMGNDTILSQCAFISSSMPVYVQTQLSDLSFCLLLMQGSRHKNELEASPSLIADLKSPVTITLYRLIYSLLTLKDFDSYSVNTFSYSLSSIVNYQEHAQGQIWVPSVILILFISQNQNLSPHPRALQGRSEQPPPAWSLWASASMGLWGLQSLKVKQERVGRVSSWTELGVNSGEILIKKLPTFSISYTLFSSCFSQAAADWPPNKAGHHQTPDNCILLPTQGSIQDSLYTQSAK